MKVKLLGRIGCLGGVAAVCAAAGLAAGAPVASAASVTCAAITGSGSSLQSLAQEKVWTKDFDSTPGGWELEFGGLKCSSAPTVTYTATSSGKGESEWGAGSGTLVPADSGNGSTLDEYIGTDVGPEGTETTGQIGEMNKAGKTKIVTIPVAQSAISVIVSLPVGCTVSGSGGFVKNVGLWKAWSKASHASTTFEELIGGVTLSGTSCKDVPTLEARETASGTTAGFKRYLDDLEPTEFGTCTSNAVESESPGCWPSAPSETGNNTGGKLAEKVAATAGSVGYADSADSIAQKFPPHPGTAEKIGSNGYESIILEVPNHGTSEGTPESPLGSKEESNCSKAKYSEPTKVAANVDWSKAKQTNATAGEEGVYPICTLTFDVAWEKYSAVGAYSHEQYNTTFSYLSWIVTDGQTGTPLTELEKAHFYVLPTKVQEEAEEGVTMEHIFWEASNK